MTRTHLPIIVLILTIVLLTGCSTFRQAPSSATAVQPTPTMLLALPTDSSTLPTMTPMPTARPATATSSTLSEVSMEKTETDTDNSNAMEINHMEIQIGDHVLTATLVENSSADALIDALSEGPITIKMDDYGSMEKVGSLGIDLPRNDEQITTEAGDIILYQGNLFVIYYAPNSWNFTRLGKINNITAEELKEILGEDNVTITLSLQQE